MWHLFMYAAAAGKEMHRQEKIRRQTTKSLQIDLKTPIKVLSDRIFNEIAFPNERDIWIKGLFIKLIRKLEWAQDKTIDGALIKEFVELEEIVETLEFWLNDVSKSREVENSYIAIAWESYLKSLKSTTDAFTSFCYAIDEEMERRKKEWKNSITVLVLTVIAITIPVVCVITLI